MFRLSTAQFTASSFKQYINRRISYLLKISLAIGALLMFLQGRYQAFFETIVILCITFLPIILGKRFKVKVPHSFETLAVIFLYLTLFLGEVQDYYVKYWWWDIALHTGSGFLLGILGFLLVYVLNEKKEIELQLHPGFVAFFAFMFAMGMGAIWEIFEFFMDQMFKLNMQKSGLVDTMWDLIVDGIGAFVISFMGWGYLKTRDRDSFLEKWIDDFIEKNPRLFERDDNILP
ncbi:hypothetical protein OAP18_02490 [Gammaproteobacteria bacterium]|nr:hypothetical protein [Gammaproteobacteria bacterium]